MYHRGRMCARRIVRWLVEKFDRMRKGEVGILGAQDGRTDSREVFGNNSGGSTCATCGNCIFGVGDERKITLTGFFNPSDSRNLRLRRAVFQPRVQSRCDLSKFHGVFLLSEEHVIVMDRCRTGRTSQQGHGGIAKLPVGGYSKQEGGAGAWFWWSSASALL